MKFNVRELIAFKGLIPLDNGFTVRHRVDGPAGQWYPFGLVGHRHRVVYFDYDGQSFISFRHLQEWLYEI